MQTDFWQLQIVRSEIGVNVSNQQPPLFQIDIHSNLALGIPQ